MLKVSLQIMLISLQCYIVWTQSRIVGGETIDITEVPYMLSVMVNGRHICGAGVISKFWAITAAHCTSIRLGIHDLLQVRSGSSILEYGGTVHNITQIKRHEKYLYVNDNYDIAVLKVYPPFVFNQKVQPVVLPSESGKIHVKWGLVAGWGYYINNDPVLSEQLLFVILPKQPRLKCEQDYLGLYEIKSNEVCYGFIKGGRDTCRGDSGGPLINRDRIIIGITSWGRSCAVSGLPGVYVNVIHFSRWVKNAIDF